jgi:hypothetical protein
LDVAHYAVILLHQLEHNQDTWPQDILNVCERYKVKIEEKIGREIGPDGATPNSRNAALLEYDLRQVIMADRRFGSELRNVLMMDRGMAIALQNGRLYLPELARERDPRQPHWPHVQAIVVLAVVFLVIFTVCAFWGMYG